MELTTLAAILAVATIGWLATGRLRRRQQRPRATTFDVAAVEIAMPAAVVSRVRAALEARSFPTTPARIAAALEDLASAEASWTHVGVRSFASSAELGENEHRWARLLHELTTREALDLPPDEDAGYREARARGEEGPRYALVSIAVLSTSPIPDAPPASREAVRALVRDVRDACSTVASGTVVWLPDRPGEGIDERELLARAPRLVRIREA